MKRGLADASNNEGGTLRTPSGAALVAAIHDAYLSAVARAAAALVRDRLLLRRDAEAIVRLAERSTIGR